MEESPAETYTQRSSQIGLAVVAERSTAQARFAVAGCHAAESGSFRRAFRFEQEPGW